MLSNMSTHNCGYMLLFLVLAVNSNRFGILHSYMLFLPLSACSLVSVSLIPRPSPRHVYHTEDLGMQLYSYGSLQMWQHI